MNKQFVMLIGIILMLNVGMVFAADIGVIGDEKPVDVTAAKADICYNNKYEFKNCDSKAVDEVKIKEEEKLLIKTDAVYLIGIDKKETKLEDKKDSSIYIHKKVGTTYHVDNLNDIPVETYLDFYYTKQPNVITHVNKHGEKVKDFQVWEYQWTPKTCKGSGEDMVCSKDGTARIFTTLTENSVGSETFPLTFTPAQWKTDNQGYASFDGVDDYVNVNYLSNLNITSKNSTTFNIWLKQDDLLNSTVGNKYLLYKGGQYQFFYFGSTQVLTIIMLNSSNSKSTMDTNYSLLGINNLNWNMITISRNSTNNFYSLYVNGILISNKTGSIGTGTLLYTSDLVIGGSSTAGYLNGSLDNVQVFNKSLNSTEISQLYNYGRQTKGICNLITDGQVACYDFNDNSFGDGSGNGNYGTPMGFSDTTPEVNDQKTLVEGVDYTIDESSGVITLSENNIYRYLLASWTYYTTGRNTDANAILGNTSAGILIFFSSINPVYAILAMLVIILVLIVLVRVVQGQSSPQL